MILNQRIAVVCLSGIAVASIIADIVVFLAGREPPAGMTAIAAAAVGALSAYLQPGRKDPSPYNGGSLSRHIVRTEDYTGSATSHHNLPAQGQTSGEPPVIPQSESPSAGH